VRNIVEEGLPTGMVAKKPTGQRSPTESIPGENLWIDMTSDSVALLCGEY